VIENMAIEWAYFFDFYVVALLNSYSSNEYQSFILLV